MWSIVAFKRKGLQLAPNATLVNCRGKICGESSWMFGVQRNLRASLSVGATDTIRNTFSVSAARVTG